MGSIRLLELSRFFSAQPQRVNSLNADEDDATNRSRRLGDPLVAGSNQHVPTISA
jgi:hypothetical protein